MGSQPVSGLSRSGVVPVPESSGWWLAKRYKTLTEALVAQSRPNVDEIGHPENQQRMWTWVFRADAFTVFHIDLSRGLQVF